MVLAADAEHVSARVLLRKGVCLSDDHLRIFRQWGVTAVDIEGVAARPGVEAELEQRDPERLARLRKRLQLRFRQAGLQQIGRESCRARVCPYVKISVVGRP